MDAGTINTSNTVASQMRRLTQLGRPSMDITLHDQPGSFIQSYTTSNGISGDVEMTGSQQDARFDRLEITLEGGASFDWTTHSRSKSDICKIKQAIPRPLSTN